MCIDILYMFIFNYFLVNKIVLIVLKIIYVNGKEIKDGSGYKII